VNGESRSGLFIVLEGIEGSGKSTQLRLLAKWLQARAIPHLTTREPGGTQVGEEIRQILLHGHEMPAAAELLLMNAARAVFVSAVVRPALQAGKVVVADRFALSSMAYQGYGRGLDIDQVRQICAFAADGVRPDLTVVLDIPQITGEARRAHRSGADRIESAGSDFHRRVSEAYRLLPSLEPGIECISGVGEVEQVQERIRALLTERFPETFARGLG
jgi:dTMP kinase